MLLFSTMNKKHIARLLFILLCLSTSLSASSKSLNGQIGFTQTSLDNWSAGGESSWVLQLDALWKSEKKINKFSLSQRLKVSYGLTKVGNQGTRKSTDELKYDNRLSSSATLWNMPLFVGASLLTQLSEGKDYSSEPATTVSYFFDPAHLTINFGLEKQIDKSLNISGGGAIKSTIVEKSTLTKKKSEFGLTLSADYEKRVNSWLNVASLLQFFIPSEDYKKTDVYWDTSLAVPLRDNLQLGYHINLIFDKDLSDKRQIKQNLLLQYNFSL